jgi:hypothetical protein
MCTRSIAKAEEAGSSGAGASPQQLERITLQGRFDDQARGAFHLPGQCRLCLRFGIGLAVGRPRSPADRGAGTAARRMLRPHGSDPRIGPPDDPVNAAVWDQVQRRLDYTRRTKPVTGEGARSAAIRQIRGGVKSAWSTTRCIRSMLMDQSRPIIRMETRSPSCALTSRAPARRRIPAGQDGGGGLTSASRHTQDC